MLKNATMLSGRTLVAGLSGLVLAATSVDAAVTVTNVSASLAAGGFGTTFGAVPQGINAVGQVVGYYNASASFGTQVPFVYTPATGAVGLTQVTPGFVTAAAAINNAGLVVGYGQIGADINGFVYNAATSTFTGLTPAGVTTNGTNTAVKTTLNAINNTGIAVGYVGYDGTNSGTRAYRGLTYNTTTNTGRDVGSAYSGPVVAGNSTPNQNIIGGINDSGILAGFGPNTGGVGGTAAVNNTQVFFRAVPTGGTSYTHTDLTPAINAASGPSYSSILSSYVGIDTLGNVAGSFKSAGSTSSVGFFYDATAGTAVKLDFGVATRTSVGALADVGGVPVVGGQFLTTPTGGTNRAFLYQNGTFTDIAGALAGTAFANFSLTNVNGINSLGDIVVTGVASGSSTPTVFVLSGFVPVPEPAALGVLSVGAVALLRRSRRAGVAK